MIEYIKYLYTHFRSCVSINWSIPISFKRFKGEYMWVEAAKEIRLDAKKYGDWQGYLMSEEHRNRLAKYLELQVK